MIPTLDDVEADLARRRLAWWIRRGFPGYTIASLHEKLIHALERVARGECTRLMVFMPPRMGKTEAASVNFPAWYLGRHPDHQVLMASYAAALSHENSRKARNLFETMAPRVFGEQISNESAAADNWGPKDRRGRVVAVGVDGGATGKGADLLIIDDPVKDQQEAYSEAIRARNKDWYRMVARTRLHPGGRIVIVQTRWHGDDLAGWLLSEAAAGTGEQWEVLSLPMVAEDGALLWPERWNQPTVDAIKKAAGSSAWHALYQQNPLPADGGMLKRTWWKFYTERPKCPVVIQSWDMAFKGTATSDFVVGQVWGRSGANYYLLDQVRGRWDAPETVKQVRALSKKWPHASAKLVEEAANGAAVIAWLRGPDGVDGLIPVKPLGGKEARVAAIAGLVEGGNVYLPDPKVNPWVEDFIVECTGFPTAKHDDQVDGMSQALVRLRGISGAVTRMTNPSRERPQM